MSNKIFQIENGKCHWDASSVVETVYLATQRFSPACLFVEAPGYVQEGWIYDPTKKGNERFIKPIEEIVEENSDDEISEGEDS